MKKALGIVAVGLCSLFFVAGQANAAGLSDSTIVSKLLGKLAGHNAAYRGVDVCSKKGVVGIHGSVKTEEQKAMATDLAKQINGVTEVNNELVVK